MKMDEVPKCPVRVPEPTYSMIKNENVDNVDQIAWVSEVM